MASIDMRGSWAANVARSQAKHEARLNIQRAETAAVEVAVKRGKNKRNKQEAPEAPAVDAVVDTVVDTAPDVAVEQPHEGDVVTE